MRLPEGWLLRLQIRNAASLWIGLHAIVAILTRGEIVIFSVGSTVAVLVITALFAHLDLRNRRELIFLSNLGVSPNTVTLVWMLVVSLLEVALAAAVRAIGE
jgi:hypothetical protein